MIIDEDGLCVPTRYTATETIETDHKAIIVTPEMTAWKDDEDKEPANNKRWNINSERSVK